MSSCDAASRRNRSGGERYAIPFFCDSNIDWPWRRCRRPWTGQAAEYPTTYYSDYMVWYQKRNYDCSTTPTASGE